MPYDAQNDAMADVPDEALLTLFANGDEAAARALTVRLLPRVLAQAVRMLGERAEADDVAQEALLRLWKIAPEWRRGEAQVSTWLYRVTANLCTDRLRKRARSAPLEAAPEPTDESASAAQQMQSRSRAEALSAALAELPERQREAVVLRHIEGLGNPQIAQMMDISAEAVESLTARGKRALTAILSGRRDELGFSDD